jgi:hypothetical protein
MHLDVATGVEHKAVSRIQVEQRTTAPTGDLPAAACLLPWSGVEVGDELVSKSR